MYRIWFQGELDTYNQVTFAASQIDEYAEKYDFDGDHLRAHGETDLTETDEDTGEEIVVGGVVTDA